MAELYATKPRKSIYFLLVLLALLSALSVYRESWKPLVLDYMSPISMRVQNMSLWFSDWGQYWKTQDELLAKIDNLSKENEALKTKVINQHHALQENATLKALLELPLSPSYKKVSAQVIAQAPDQWFSRLQINAGFLKGLAPDQTVISGRGLVGKILSVTQDTALIELISQPDHAVACYSEKEKQPAMLIGQLPGEYAKLKYLQSYSKLEPGEKIFTSGKGKGFPPHLLLGEVAEVKKTPGVPAPEVKVKLTAFGSDLNFVYVLVPEAEILADNK